MATERKQAKRNGKPRPDTKTKTRSCDGDSFSPEYSDLSRSINGLPGTGEWHAPEKMLPDFCGKRVLDLGCGDGRHCRYAIEHGAIACTGIDISEKTLKEAWRQNASFWTDYRLTPIEEFEYEPDTFDIVISSLALHHVDDFNSLCKKIHRCLTPGGVFLFSIDHPIYTASDARQGITGGDGEKRQWPVDRYFDEGRRETDIPGHCPARFHKTLTSWINGLLDAGFTITGLAEPDKTLPESAPGLADERRRPMILTVSAVKN